MNATRIVKSRGLKLAAACLMVFGLVGCNAAQLGALYGAGIGAGIGAASNRHQSGKNALIGAGIGTIAGYLIGNEVDKANHGYGYPAYSAPPSHVDVYYEQSYYSGHHHHRSYGGHYHRGHCDW